jgi:uncharacterized membrane protein
MKTVKIILKWIFGIAFILAGINHFLNTNFYLRMMPPIFPAHLFLIYLSGVCETVLGVLLLIPKFTKFASLSLIALLIAVFPANIYMALNPQIFPEISPIAQYIRLPIQLILIAWAYWFTRSADIPVRKSA